MTIDNGVPGILRVDVGHRFSGSYSAADEAFKRAFWEVARLENHATWNVFLERIRTLEHDFADAGGLNPAVQEALDSPYGYFGSTDLLKRHEKAVELLDGLEEFAAAFLLTLQTRLTAVDAKAMRVYSVAREVDLIQGLPQYSKTQILKKGNVAFSQIWSVANYVKHNDEWTASLTSQQKSAFEALKQLGLAKETPKGREFEPWLVSAAIKRVSGKADLSLGLLRTIEICQELCFTALTRVQEDFTSVAGQIETAREQNAARRKLEEARRREEERES